MSTRDADVLADGTRAAHRGACGPVSACETCARRSWLVGRLSGHLDQVRRRIFELLECSDDELVAAVGGRQAMAIAQELEAFDSRQMRQAAADAGLSLVCRCTDGYPAALRGSPGAPALLYATGPDGRLASVCDRPAVAIVGSRRPTAYGLSVAQSLGRALGRVGVPVVSGMALGIDSAALSGACSAAGPTIAVLPGPASIAYPASRRPVHRALMEHGVAVSEFGPGVGVRRWSLTARNRVIAALSMMTVVVEAGQGSGALLTAQIAQRNGRHVGAVPGRLGTPVAEGPHALIAAGARIVRGAQDIVDCLYGVGFSGLDIDERQAVSGRSGALLARLAHGEALGQARAQLGMSVTEALGAVAELELAGRLRRRSGGGFDVVA